ncbi:MAG: hypothetical protein WBA02_15320 [Jannaschia helgolandensis]|uniref:hypothetical protein n=1 Tax=Jannaschia helgolandensis TaxID=188906 RepID=UPI003C71081D
MQKSLAAAVTVALIAIAPSIGHAAVCDYKPSKLFGRVASTMTDTGAAPVSTDVTNATAGSYTLIHAQSGSSLLNRAVSGRSVTETVAVASGASGILATLASIATAPVTLIAGAVTAVALGSYEGACYFSVDRVTDSDKILAILQDMERTANPDYFWMETPEDADGPMIYVRDLEDANKLRSYEVSRLYIADGLLKHRDLALNTTIGKVIYTEPVPVEAPAD